MKTRIRPAAVSDAQHLGDLAMRSKAMWGYSNEFMEQCRNELTVRPADITDRRNQYRVYELQSHVVGFYALHKTSAAEFDLDALFVDPDYTRRGIGKHLLDHAKTTTAVEGASVLTVDSDPHAEGFYIAAGGVATGLRQSASIAGRYLRTFAFNLNV